MQPGQILYTETEKKTEIWRSMRSIKHNIYIQRALHRRVETRKFSSRVVKYLTSERSEPTTVLKHVSQALKNWSDKGEICYVTTVTLIFSRVNKIGSLHAKVYLVRYFVGFPIISTFLSCSINLFLWICVSLGWQHLFSLEKQLAVVIIDG